MRFGQPFSGTLLASTTAARSPTTYRMHRHAHMARDVTFNIQVENRCNSLQFVGLFQVASDFVMIPRSDVTDLESGEKATITAPYSAIGMRLSGTANQGPAYQYQPQALFEFGYAKDGHVEGTAYDLSVMQGSRADIGIATHPSNPACPSKSCSPDHCPVDQGWTSPKQTSIGSPADAVCYYGPTDFLVIFCP